MGLGSNNVPTGWGAGEDSLDRIFKREEQQKQDLIKWWKEVKEISEHHVYLNELIFNDNEDYIDKNLPKDYNDYKRKVLKKLKEKNKTINDLHDYIVTKGHEDFL